MLSVLLRSPGLFCESLPFSLVCSTFSHSSHLHPGHSRRAASHCPSPNYSSKSLCKLVFHGYGVSFGEDEELLEMDGGDGCTRV